MKGYEVSRENFGTRPPPSSSSLIPANLRLTHFIPCSHSFLSLADNEKIR